MRALVTVAAVTATLLLGGVPGAATAVEDPQPPPGSELADAQAAADLAYEEHVRRYVVAVYQDLFDRQPDPAGLDAWTQALLTGTPRVAVANGITSSREFRASLVDGAYEHYLGRGPDPAGLEGWLAAMGAGLTIARIEAGFIASDEYFARYGGTFEGWVEALYEDVLGRGAAASEVQAWTAALRAGAARDRVALGFLLSTEHLSTVVDGYYQHLLGRGIDPEGRRAWVAALQAGVRDEAIIGGIVASEEYWGALSTATGIALFLVEETVGAGDPVHPWVYTVDRSGQPLEHVTRDPGTTITIDGVPCLDALCPTTTPGRKTVTATYRGWTDSTDVTVVLGPPARLEVAIPATATAGAAVPYTVAAFDRGGNALGDVTAQVTLAGTGTTGASCAAGTCTFMSIGGETLSASLTTAPAVRRDGIHVEVGFPVAPAGLALHAWGGDDSGQLPVGGGSGTGTPALSSATWADAETGWLHTAALRNDGTLWQWGDNISCLRRPGRPTLVPGTGWTAVDAAWDQTVALRADGSLWGWGYNGQQQLGGAEATCVPEPRQLPGGGTWVAASAAAGATYAIRPDGSLWGWGRNGLYGVGDGGTGSASVATRIGTDTWTAVSGGGRMLSSFALGIRSDGTLWRWGSGAGGRSTVPVQVGTDTDWVDIEAGWGTGAAIKSDGSLWLWGGREQGLVPGHDPAASPDVPVQVGAGTRWVDISVGMDAALALAEDGTLWGWGDNQADQLDNGAQPVGVPTQIAPGTTWTSTSLGINHAVGVR